MINSLLNSINFFEVCCLIVAIIYFHKYRKSPCKWILPYLILVVSIESLGWYLRSIHLNNGYLYNILAFIELMCFCYIFSKYERDTSRSIIYPSAFIVGSGAILIDGILISDEGFIHFLNYGIAICDSILGLLSIYVIWNFVRTEKVLFLNKMLIFWISAGLLIFHLCSIPITVISNIFQEISPETNKLLLLQTVSGIAMYISFSIGFIWSEQKYNS